MSSSPSPEAPGSSFEQWLSSGESLYGALQDELKVLEAQVAALQIRIEERRSQVQKLARLLNRPLPPAPPAAHPVSRAADGAGNSAELKDDALRIPPRPGRPVMVRPVRRPDDQSPAPVPFRQ